MIIILYQEKEGKSVSIGSSIFCILGHSFGKMPLIIRAKVKMFLQKKFNSSYEFKTPSILCDFFCFCCSGHYRPMDVCLRESEFIRYRC